MNRREFLSHAAGAAILSTLPIMESRAMTLDENPYLQGGFAPVPDEVTLDNLPVTGGESQGQTTFLQKPFSPEDLIRLVREILHSVSPA